MRTVSKRQLNQRTAEVLEKVTDTDDVVVTDRGKPRWRITTARESETTPARLEREGRYTPPSSEPAPWPATPGGPKDAADVADALIDEMRGDHWPVPGPLFYLDSSVALPTIGDIPECERCSPGCRRPE